MGVASAVFWLPIVRDFYLWFGSVHADKRTMLGQLSAGNSVILLPGGIKEQLTNCGPHEDVVVLKHRKGFIRLALETGSPLVPVYCFGERRAYVPQRGLLHAASKALKRLLNIGAPAVRGRWFTLMPLPVPLTLVVGAPIEVPPQFARLPKDAAGASSPAPVAVLEANKDSMSLEEAVDVMHARFCAALQQLYDEHKDACGYKDVALVIR
jgi:2-acylglycerol O-acyltransferase 2